MPTTSWWSSSDWCVGEFPNESFEIRSWPPCKRSCSRFLIDERPSREKEILGRDKARGQARVIARLRTKTCERGHLGGSSPSQVTEPTASGAGMNHLPWAWPELLTLRSMGKKHRHLSWFGVPSYQLVLLSFPSCPLRGGFWKVYWKSSVLLSQSPVNQEFIGSFW